MSKKVGNYLSGGSIKVKENGWIERISLSIRPPSLEDNRGDLDRLLFSIRPIVGDCKIDMPLDLISKIPNFLRSYHYKTDILYFKDDNILKIIDLFPAGFNLPLYGIAIDLGTSNIALSLIDIVKGKEIYFQNILNPQIKVGPDILSRIHFAEDNRKLAELQEMVIDAINREIEDMIHKIGIKREHLVGMSVAGNTTMSHLFLSLDPHWICREPYIPCANRFPILRAKELGIFINQNAPVFIFPNVGSYLGGDIISGIFSLGLEGSERLFCFIDVGTNAEIVIGSREWMIGCAGAAGPALEGGVGNIGMMAGKGVIDRISYDANEDRFKIHLIGEGSPKGLCGSAMIDLISELFLYGFLDERGRFVKERCKERLEYREDEIRFFILRPGEFYSLNEGLYITQAEVDSLIRSKAAMYTILRTITKMLDIDFNDIHRFYIAGSFGSYMNPRSAINIGMLPDIPIERFKVCGNTSLEGAKRLFFERDGIRRIYSIRDNITYVELNVNQEFMNLFSGAKFLPHTDISLFPSVKKRLSSVLR